MAWNNDVAVFTPILINKREFLMTSSFTVHGQNSNRAQILLWPWPLIKGKLLWIK